MAVDLSYLNRREIEFSASSALDLFHRYALDRTSTSLVFDILIIRVIKLTIFPTFFLFLLFFYRSTARPGPIVNSSVGVMLQDQKRTNRVIV